MRYPVLASFAAVALAGGASAQTLIHDYEFDTASTTRFYDSVAGGTDGSLYNGASVSGGSLHLDGVNDFAQFDSLVFPAGNTAFSVFFTFENHTVDAGYYAEVVSQDGGSFYIGQIGSGTRVSDAHGSTSTPFPMDGGRYSYLLTNDGSTATLSINGVQVWSDTAVSSTASGGSAYIGRQYSCCYGEFFQGDIDNLRIFSGVTSWEQASNIGGVPEPASWAMMLAGFGLAGASMRAARRKHAFA
jgi:hypothetical protein